MHKRDLPWRDRAIKDSNEHAYQVLVSEVMLQQTQVARVKIVFMDFLVRFPRMRDLAAASNRDVLIAWRGMGYNRRALQLRDAARYIVGRAETSNLKLQTSNFPREMIELQKIPGVGLYTAAAIRNFAFGIPTPCIDTNIRRVLHRTFVGPENPDGTWKASDKELLKLAEEVLEVALSGKGARYQVSGIRRTAAEWHAALMDYGSLVQTKTSPKWDLCPLTKKGLCKAANILRHAERPPSSACAEPVEASRGQSKHVARKREPGRFVGAVFIPNRIFRGKIVEELRDARRGLPLRELGKRICLDWQPAVHQGWLKRILAKLESDALIEQRREKYVLKE